MQQQLISIIFSLLIFHSTQGAALAAPVTQNITLRPGWNAVFLKVQPPSTDPTDVFSSITDLNSVWAWNPRTSPVEFIQNPSQLVPDEPTMMVYIPADAILTNLHAIHGNRAYLVNIGGAADQILSVTGEPLVPGINWKPNSFNFVGFHLEVGSEPYLEDFFSGSAAHAGQEIYILNSSGQWELLASPATTQMKDGEGFWVYCKGNSEFNGPLSVQLEQGDGLIYGEILVEQEIIIKNDGLAEATLNLSVSDSAFPLYYWNFDEANSVSQWSAFPPSPLTIAAGNFQKLRLGVKRADLTGMPGDTSISNVKLSNNSGVALLIPASVTLLDYSGLWVGDAVISKVNQPGRQDSGDPSELLDTGSQFAFRILLHVTHDDPATTETDETSVRLLKEIIQMWQEGGWIPDPNDLGKLITDPDNPGEFVLLADDSLVSQYSGAALRDGQSVARRISSPAFGNFYAEDSRALINDPKNPDEQIPDFEPYTSLTKVSTKTMIGSFSPEDTLTVTLWLPMDDPTNPFVHKFDPDHRPPVKTQDPETGFDTWSKLKEKRFDITRTITLDFTDQDSSGQPLPSVDALSWGSTDVCGVYQESISGLQKDVVNMEIEGVFLLHKVSSAPLVLQ